MHQIRLVVNLDSDDGTTEETRDLSFEDEVIYLGRAPGNDVELTHGAVSATHARIIRQDSDYFLDDLASRNGTYLNGKRLLSREKKLLRDGDRITVVNYTIEFRAGLSAIPEEESTSQIALDMIKNVLGGALGPEETPPRVIVMTGKQQGRYVELSDIYNEIVVGRSPNCGLVLDEDNISREHCLIRRDWNGVSVRDLNSRNGVQVNEVKIEKNVEVRLNDRDELKLGTAVLQFSDPAGAELADKVGEFGGDEGEEQGGEQGGEQGEGYEGMENQEQYEDEDQEHREDENQEQYEEQNEEDFQEQHEGVEQGESHEPVQEMPGVEMQQGEQQPEGEIPEPPPEEGGVKLIHIVLYAIIGLAALFVIGLLIMLLIS